MIPILREEFSPSGAAFEQARFGPRLRWLKDSVVGDLDDTLWLLMGTIGLLLVIACANVANLVLVRTETRRPELAIRTALGAGWAAVARVVIAESAILGLAGGAAGVVVAYVSLPLLLSLGADRFASDHDRDDRPTVLLVALGTSVLATLMFALIPVFHFARAKPHLGEALRRASDLRAGEPPAPASSVGRAGRLGAGAARRVGADDPDVRACCARWIPDFGIRNMSKRFSSRSRQRPCPATSGPRLTTAS